MHYTSLITILSFCAVVYSFSGNSINEPPTFQEKITAAIDKIVDIATDTKNLLKEADVLLQKQVTIETANNIELTKTTTNIENLQAEISRIKEFTKCILMKQ